MKSDRDAANCWRSLLEGQYECDPMIMDQMEKKMTLEKISKRSKLCCTSMALLHLISYCF